MKSLSFSDMEELIHPDDRERFSEHLRAHIDDFRPFHINLRWRTKSGEFINIVSEGEALRNPDGSVSEMVGVVSTERFIEGSGRALGGLECSEIVSEMGKIARIGWWELDFRTGKVFWSEQVKMIHEVPMSYSPTFEDAVQFNIEPERHELSALIEESRATFQDYFFIGRVRTAKGNLIWLRSYGKPVVVEGECIGIRGVCIDVTEEKNRELLENERSERLKRALVYAQTGLFEWNLETDEVFWDRGCCLINGIDADEKRMHIEEIHSNIHEDDFADWQKGTQQLKNVGDVMDSEHRIIGVDGVTRWVYVRAEIVDSGDGIRRLVGMATDITERQKAREELLGAKEAADRANRAKSEFLAMMNHELRTPLSTIIGPCELALQITEDPEVRRFLELSMESGRHLLDLINRVLDLARIESNEMERRDQRVHIRPFLRDFLKPISSAAMRKGISLAIEFNCEEEIILDPVVVRQVLYNLVGNAIKYCGGGRVSVSVQSRNGELTLAVKDQGPGISEEEKEKIFDQFHRVPSGMIARVEGSGLGLAICRRLADLVGGALEVESVEGQGSVFIFRMPISPLPEEPGKRDRVRRAKRTRSDQSVEADTRILIVEDNEPNRAFIEAVVRSVRVPFDSCETGEEAVEKFQPGVHRVVLMDIYLPGMKGHQAVERIREKAGSEPVYVIAQTAGVVAKEQANTLFENMDDLVSKPIGLSTFVEAIRRGLEASSGNG